MASPLASALQFRDNSCCCKCLPDECLAIPLWYSLRQIPSAGAKAQRASQCSNQSWQSAGCDFRSSGGQEPTPKMSNAGV
jgi:hypothetical protein